MTYFHVRITPKSKPSQTEVELDISLEELMERFVRPYERGQSIIIAGRTVYSEDISRMQLNESEQDSTSLNATMLRQQEAQQTYSSVDQHGRLHPEMLADNGRDVTSRFIIGEPGHAAETATYPVLEHSPSTTAREVFVVSGRNRMAHDALFAFLRSIDLRPLEWPVAVQATGKPSPYIGEILDAAFSRVHAVVVLFTPDDEARLKEPFRAENDPPHETQLTGQARPNVLFEAGMAMARSQDRTILVELGNLRPYSDIGGRYTLRLDNSTQRRQELAKRLQSVGCLVNLEGTDWYTAGDFDAAILLPVQESPSATVQQPTIPEALHLSEEARELLVEAAADRGAVILVSRTFGGTVVQANGRRFAERGNRRSAARWEQAIRDLLSHELIWDPSGKGEILELTQQGFQIADGLGTS